MTAVPPRSGPHSDVSPQLVWADDGSPRSGRFGDVYFSVDDGLAESRTVFLQGCGLPQAWAGRSGFTVVELGFGTGLNIVALLDLWHRQRPPDAHLNIVSIERFPVSPAEAARALSAWPELAAVTSLLLRVWPGGTPGFHRVDLPSLNATLDVLVGEAATMLEQWSGRADAWFLDGFSPAVNPAMWSDQVLDAIAERSASDARLATFTVAGVVRRGLSERGFSVSKRRGHGRKRERLEALKDGAARPLVPAPRVAVIGGGIAGASVCRALRARGCRPLLIEATCPGAGASGFEAALVTPRLDAGDRVIAGFHAQALERARHLYCALPDAVAGDGVIQLAATAKDAARFAKIADQSLWSEREMIATDAETTSREIGQPASEGGLRMAGALSVRPGKVLAAWLDGVKTVTAKVARLQRLGNGWRILGSEGVTLAEADHVVVASGPDAARLLPDVPLSPVRGQAEWVAGGNAPAVAWGGYVAPGGQGVLYGATHDRGDQDDRPREDDRARNLATLRGRLPILAGALEALPTRSRAAVRATTPDRLPLCGPVDAMHGVWMLGGLGSRGFCVAPLLGEHLAAIILGLPSPLPSVFAERLRTDRFGPDLPEEASR